MITHLLPMVYIGRICYDSHRQHHVLGRSTRKVEQITVVIPNNVADIFNQEQVNNLCANEKLKLLLIRLKRKRLNLHPIDLLFTMNFLNLKLFLISNSTL